MWEVLALVLGPLALALGAYFFRRGNPGGPAEHLADALLKSAHESRQVRYEERKASRRDQLEEDMAQPPTDLDDLLDEAERLHKKGQ